MTTPTRHHNGELAFTVALYNPSQRPGRQRLLSVRIGLSFVLSGAGQQETLHKVREAIATQIEKPLRTSKISGLAGRDGLDALGLWVARRLTRTYGQWLQVERVELSYGSDGVVHDARKGATAQSPQPGSNGRRPAKDDGAGRYLRWLLGHELTAPYGGGHRFTRRTDVARVSQLLRDASAEYPVRFCTLVCPPYLKEHNGAAHAGYVGLASDFSRTPSGYHRSYDYVQYFRSLTALETEARRLSLAVAPTIVFADRGLIGLDSLRTTLPTDSLVLRRLSAFDRSMRKYAAANFPRVGVVSLRGLGITPLMPLGLPTADQERVAWLTRVRDQAMSEAGAAILDLCLALLGRQRTLVRLEHWRNYRPFVAQQPIGVDKGDLYDVLKMYSNIVWIRKREAFAAQEAGGPAMPTLQLRRTAMIDALVRWVQYGMYANAVAQHLSPAVLVYQDDGFTACGNALRLPNLPVLFVDPALAVAATPAD